MIKDLHLFARKIVLKKLHNSRTPPTQWSDEELRAIQILQELEEESEGDPLGPSEELQNVPVYPTSDNLTRAQRKAVKELGQMKDIVIKSADKGGNVVLWPTAYQEALRNMVECAFQQGTINKNTRDVLINETPRVACLYLLPKIHKDTKNPPGRPIVSGNQSLCEEIFPLDRLSTPYLHHNAIISALGKPG